MLNGSYVKLSQRGSIQASFGVIGLSFGILAWIVNFINVEFNSLQDFNSLSSVQSAGTLIINQLDETGNQADISQQLNSLKQFVGANPSLCMVYFEDDTPTTFSPSSCEEYISQAITEAVINSGFKSTVVSFSSTRPEEFSLNQIAGPGTSTANNYAYTNTDTNSAFSGENPVCYSTGRRLICDSGSGTHSVQDPDIIFESYN